MGAASTLRFEDWVQRLREFVGDELPEDGTTEEAAIAAQTLRFKTTFLQKCVNDAIKAYSLRKPLLTKGALTVSDGTTRYDVQANLPGAVRIDEIWWEDPANDHNRIRYTFAHDVHDDVLVFLRVGSSFGLPSGNTVQVYYAKTHTALTDNGTTTVPTDDEEAVLHYAASVALKRELTEILKNARHGLYNYKRGRVSVNNAAAVEDLRKQIEDHRAQFKALTQGPFVLHGAGRPPDVDQTDANEYVDRDVGPFGSRAKKGDDRWPGLDGANDPPRW